MEVAGSLAVLGGSLTFPLMHPSFFKLLHRTTASSDGDSCARCMYDDSNYAKIAIMPILCIKEKSALVVLVMHARHDIPRYDWIGCS